MPPNSCSKGLLHLHADLGGVRGHAQQRRLEAEGGSAYLEELRRAHQDGEALLGSVHEHADLLRVVRHDQRHRRGLVLDAAQLGDALVAGGRAARLP
eukprot:16429755-Heterocapsa_arctica.AAC.1